MKFSECHTTQFQKAFCRAGNKESCGAFSSVIRLWIEDNNCSKKFNQIFRLIYEVSKICHILV